MSKKTILVPVDFSPHSEAALVFAGNIAAQINSHLIVLHVVHDPAEAPGYYKGHKNRRQKMEDTAKEMMDGFLEKVRKKNGDPQPLKKAERTMLTGLPVTRILQTIEQLQPDMVIMGSQGRTGLSHLWLGSKAEQVTRLSPVPVTIVKAEKV